ncbi:helix-turn-helix transcriptional regulator [Pelagibius sp. Alg239-R121]|uniref:ArsR/SmtB family transcription factor n=1 Tax=Pelagibius sp. Alg239-R121 TaxID=2993448 RepID=UPI0024A772B1|nr:winged helix-turn-helix domain-containing protein [Pelagibius sp. Alg239-R121]
MTANLDISKVGKLLGDPSRVEIISALIDGRSLTARELAHGAGVSASTASFHLSKLVDAGMLVVLSQSRHHFYRVASTEVGAALQALLRIAPSGKAKPAARRKNEVCFARTCYGHLAGVLGLAVAEALQSKGLIEAQGEDDFAPTEKGERFFAKLGMDLAGLRSGRRLFARQCLDWSERKPHLGGALGQAFTDNLVKRKWLRKKPGSREVRVTKEGQAGLRKLLGIKTGELSTAFFLEEPVSKVKTGRR